MHRKINFFFTNYTSSGYIELSLHLYQFEYFSRKQLLIIIDKTSDPDETIKQINDSSNCFCHFSDSSGCNLNPSSEPIHTTNDVISTTIIRKSKHVINTPQI